MDKLTKHEIGHALLKTLEKALEKADVLAFPGNPKPAVDQGREPAVSRVNMGAGNIDYSHHLPADISARGFSLSKIGSANTLRIVSPTGNVQSSMDIGETEPLHYSRVWPWAKKAMLSAAAEHQQQPTQKAEWAPGVKKKSTCRCSSYTFPHRHKGGKCKGD